MTPTSNASEPTLPHGIPDWAWDKIGAEPDGNGWKIPERNAEGEIIGWSRRLADGKKTFVKGGKRGLTLQWPLDVYAGSSMEDPVFIVEGATDTAAGGVLLLSIVGRPSATGGGEFLATLLAERHVCIIAENDQKTDKTSGSKTSGSASWPGRDGAQAIATKLLPKCASVRIIYPPEGIKDLRGWLVAGVAREDILELAAKTKKHAVPRDGDPIVVCMADVEPQQIQWLWPRRIPRGRLTLFSGRPGEGKSFVTCDMAARVSTGEPWPDQAECTQGSVVFVSAEDDPADTIHPRLTVHNANTRKIHVLTGVAVDNRGTQGERCFTLDDLAPLEQTLKQTGDDVSLVVIDPVGSYLGGDTDAHRDNEVRSVLAPLAALAERFNVAIVLVAHQRKSVSNHADNTVMGSVAFTGIARSVLHLLRDPDDDDKRLLLPGKMNLCKPPQGLSFTFEGEPAKVCWSETPEARTADEIMAGGKRKHAETPAADEAEAWLRDTLQSNGGSMPSTEIKEQADKDGISKGALGIARDRLNVRCEKQKGVSNGPWVWTQPPDMFLMPTK